MNDTDNEMRVGDVLSFAKGSAGLLNDLADKYFRVEEIQRDDTGHITAWRLSLPYEDAACTIRYHVDPQKVRGRMR